MQVDHVHDDGDYDKEKIRDTVKPAITQNDKKNSWNCCYYKIDKMFGSCLVLVETK